RPPGPARPAAGPPAPAAATGTPDSRGRKGTPGSSRRKAPRSDPPAPAPPPGRPAAPGTAAPGRARPTRYAPSPSSLEPETQPRHRALDVDGADAQEVVADEHLPRPAHQADGPPAVQHPVLLEGAHLEQGRDGHGLRGEEVDPVEEVAAPARLAPVAE